MGRLSAIKVELELRITWFLDILQECDNTTSAFKLGWGLSETIT